jgi:predicted nucleotide-binding protein
VKRTETFYDTWFGPEVLQQIKEAMGKLWVGATASVLPPRVGRNNVKWELDSDAEFYAELREGVDSYRVAWIRRNADYSPSWDGATIQITIHADSTGTTVEFDGTRRDDILTVQEVFENARETSRIALPSEVHPNVTVFVGHGRDPAWRDLKDHLQDLHGYRLLAYEVGARAGHEIRDIIGEMLDEASFACLVLTGEDAVGDGKIQARQNVIHELGLFQGRLGYHRAIALVESGIELPSNIAGVSQIRFDKGNIATTFGQVLATLRREFEDRR